jgi:hypothetical protein
MAQAGIYATIRREGKKWRVEHTHVQWALNLEANLHRILKDTETGWDISEVLKTLETIIREAAHISEIVIDGPGDDIVPEGVPARFVCQSGEDYYLWAERPQCTPVGEEEWSPSRVFDSRKAAEKFVKTHPYAEAGISLLWDLDTNLFTWFVPPVPKKYAEHASCLRAYDFKNDCFTTCFEVTYSLDEMEAGGEERELEIVSGMPDRKIVSAHTDAEEKPAKDSEPDDAFTFASTDGPGKLTYSMREETPLLVSGSIYSLRAMGPSVNIDRQFTGLTYTATFDARFGFETWVYRLMQDGKQVWRTSIPADSYDGIKSSLLEGLCATVISLVKYPPSKEMYKGLYYNDLDHVFESKILRTVETSLYRHLMEKTAPYGQKRISGLTKLLKDTLHRVDSAKNTEERKRLMARLVAYDPQADEFTLIPGGKEEVFREGGPKKGWFYFAYSVIVAAPVFVPEFDEGDLVSSVQVYTKEGYSQETIALLLGMTVKQVADIQKAGR